MTGRLAALALLVAVPAAARSVADAPRDAPATATLAPKAEPGDRMRLVVAVEDAAGKPVRGAVVYAYHTDVNGSYGPGGSSDPRLFGYARTGADGRITLDTIRPGPYPQGGNPAHVHVEIAAAGSTTHDECWFAGDRFLRDDLVEHERKRGRLSRVVTLEKKDGVWRGTWTLQLARR
jgi:protocatechuate 3,4-dioxygenase beta subunit